MADPAAAAGGSSADEGFIFVQAFQTEVEKQRAESSAAPSESDCGGGGGGGGSSGACNKGRKAAASNAFADTVIGDDGKKMKVDTSKPCMCCGEHSAFGFARCWIHKRALDNVRKQAIKGYKKGAPLSEQPEAWQDYVEIFGEGREGPSDMALANRVLLDYCLLNKDTLMVKGAKKIPIDLSEYRHTHFAESCSTDDSMNPKWDWELFSTQLKNLRGWSPEKCLQVWNELLADPTVWKGTGGYGAHSELVSVPANLVGMQYFGAKQRVGESKSLSMKSKTSARSSEDVAAMRSELTRGFEARQSITDFQAATSKFTAALGSGAVTAECSASGSIAEKLMRVAVGRSGLAGGSVAPGTPAMSMARCSPSKAPGSVVDAGGEETPNKESGGGKDKPKSLAPHQLEDARNRKFTAVNLELSSLKTRFTYLLIEGNTMCQGTDSESHGLFYSTLKSRLETVRLFMNVEVLQGPGSDNGKPGLWEVKDIQGAEGTAGADARFQAHLDSLPFLPMESKDLPTLPSLEEQLKSAHSVRDAQGLERFADEYDQQQDLFNQLSKSAKTAITELANSVRRLKASDEKAKRAAAKQGGADNKRAKASQEQATREAAASPPPAALFDTNLSAVLAAKSVPEDDGDDNLMNLAGPFVLKQAKTFTDILASDAAASPLMRTFKMWMDKFGGQGIYRTTGSVTAPCLSTMGAGELDSVFSTILPGDSTIKSDEVWFQQATKDLNLFALSPSYVRLDFEMDLLGSVTFVGAGMLKVVLVNFVPTLKGYLALEPKKQLDIEKFRAWCLSLGAGPNLAAALQVLQGPPGEVILMTATVGAGDCLYCPPGFLLGCRPCNGEPVSGFRRYCLPRAAGPTVQAMGKSTDGHVASGSSLQKMIAQVVSVAEKALAASVAPAALVAPAAPAATE